MGLNFLKCTAYYAYEAKAKQRKLFFHIKYIEAGCIAIYHIHIFYLQQLLLFTVFSDYVSDTSYWLRTLVRLSGRYTSVLLTHRGRVTHIRVGNLTNIGSDNGLSPSRRQAIIWSSAEYC